jgi:CheY-like chemotaxis protein
MAATAVWVSSTCSRIRPRTALVASADGSFRQRLNAVLTGLRWQVREAEGGAQAWGEAMDALPQTIIVDSWLPDLDMAEFLREFRAAFPDVDVVTTGSALPLEGTPGPHRQEILYALRRIQETDTAAWNTAPSLEDATPLQPRNPGTANLSTPFRHLAAQSSSSACDPGSGKIAAALDAAERSVQKPRLVTGNDRIPELIGNSPCMLEISRRIRLVAPRSTPVLIEGPTGSGKELVVHQAMIASEKASMAFEMALAVRNKAIQSYQSVMSMQF